MRFSFLFFSIIFCGIASFTKAQSIEKLIAQTKEYFAVYETLRPFVEYYYPVKDFNFSKQELPESKKEELEEIGDIKNDSIGGWPVIEIFQNRILNTIDKIIRHKDFSKIETDWFTVSPDKKLFNFTLFENTGGSYHSYISVIYYRDHNKIVYKEVSREKEGSIFASDGYDSIDTIQTNSGVKYLLQGAVRGCGSCLGQYITLVKFEDGNPVCEFSYSLSTRTNWEDNIIKYDAETKTITIAYKTDDFTSDCICESKCNDDDSSYSRSYDEDGIPKYCRCVFGFNGETFELDEESWQRRKEER
jgi:hypothetical protein